MWKALLGAAVLVGSACTVGAYTLFKRVIPRQDTLRVDLSEMADMQKWEEYRKFITPNREWLTSQKLEHITIKSYDGLELHADYLPSDKGGNKLVICNHGYTGRGMQDCSSIAVFFHNLGYDCLIVDHRAHGQSQGDYIGFGILDRYDCRAWIDYIDKRFDKKKSIVLYGVSMGGTIVLMTSAISGLSASVKAVIADCAFTSPYDVFAHILHRDYHLPVHPIMDINNAFCRKKAGYGFSDYSTLDAVKESKVPIMFIHGENDDFVPVWMSKKNYEQCQSEKELLLVENAAHAASYYEATELYQNKVKAFVEKYVI